MKKIICFEIISVSNTYWNDCKKKKPKFPLEAITGILVAIVLIQVVTLHKSGSLSL